MGWFSSAALREATILKRLLKLPSYVVNGSGEATGLVDANGNPLTSSPLSLLSHRPYPWDLNLDDRIRIDAACLSGYGAATLPIEFRADPTNEMELMHILRPTLPQGRAYLQVLASCHRCVLTLSRLWARPSGPLWPRPQS